MALAFFNRKQITILVKHMRVDVPSADGCASQLCQVEDRVVRRAMNPVGT